MNFTFQRKTKKQATLFLILSLCFSFSVQAAVPEENLAYQLERGLMVLQAGSSAYVKRGTEAKVPLMLRVESISVSNDKSKVTISNASCRAAGYPFREITFNLDQLEARIENVAALRFHQAKQYEKAILGFQKALKLDPQFEVAAYNLACAFNLLGKTEEAIQVLAPFLKENLPKTYLEITLHPELRSLANTKALKALQVSGTAQIRKREQNWAAFSQKHQLLAVYDPELGMRVYNAQTGKYLATWNLGNEWFFYGGSGDIETLEKEHKQALSRDFTKKTPVANQFLSQFGFVELTEKEPGKLDSDLQKKESKDQDVEPGITFLRFPSKNLRLSLSQDGTGHLRKGDEVLASFDLRLARVFLEKGFYLPQVNSIIFGWKAHGGNECHRHEGTEAMVNLQAPMLE